MSNENSTSSVLRGVESVPAGALRFPEWLSLKKLKSEAGARAFTGQDAGFREFEFGLAALKDGVQIGSGEGGTDAALLLLVSASRLLIRATALRSNLAAEAAAWPEIWAATTGSASWFALHAADEAEAVRRASDCVNAPDIEAHIARLTPAERRALLTPVSAFAKRIAAPLEDDASGVRRATVLGRMRLALAALVVLLPVAWLVLSLTRLQNLALGSHVLLSDSDPMFGVDPKYVVDGDRTNLGFHTTARPNTTVTIDLGALKSLHRVDVYNRADCCQERVVPLVLEVSEDGSWYHFIARNSRIFDYWSVPCPASTKARFVRLTHESALFFHLSEVEVY